MTSPDKKVAQEYGCTHEKDSNNQQSYVLHGSILFIQTRFFVIPDQITLLISTKGSMEQDYQGIDKSAEKKDKTNFVSHDEGAEHFFYTSPFRLKTTIPTPVMMIKTAPTAKAI